MNDYPEPKLGTSDEHVQNLETRESQGSSQLREGPYDGGTDDPDRSSRASSDDVGREMVNRREKAGEEFDRFQNGDFSPMEKWLTRRGEYELLKEHRMKTFENEAQYRREMASMWYQSRLQAVTEKANAMIKQHSAHIRADLAAVANSIRQEMQSLMVEAWTTFLDEQDRLLDRIDQIERPERREMIRKKADAIEYRFIRWYEELVIQLEDSVKERVRDFEGR